MGVNKIYNYIKLSYSVLCLLILFYCSNAFGRVALFRENAYLNLGVGEFQPNRFEEREDVYIKKRPRMSHVFSVGAGYRFSSHFRSTVNFQYSKVTYKARDNKNDLRQKIRTTSGMINIDWDMYPNSFLSPYVTGGVGVSRNQPAKLTDIKYSLESQGRKSKTNFAWNIGCGVLLNTFGDSYLMDFGYRYVNLGKFYTKGFIEQSSYVSQRLTGHEAIVWVTFKL
ncbi:MAG: porin family protein [Rickettsiales bacterium]|nr:porin family protein [Rickettsiales bacterium]